MTQQFIEPNEPIGQGLHRNARQTMGQDAPTFARREKLLAKHQNRVRPTPKIVSARTRAKAADELNNWRSTSQPLQRR